MTTGLWGVVAVLGVSALGAFGQTPDIVAFRNGELTWTNDDPSLFYQVEWASSLTVSDAWHCSYQPLRDIQSTNPTVTSFVPMFYRVSGTSRRVTYGAPVRATGQASTYQTGDDGSYTNGTPWPIPRFTIETGIASNCVTDNLTGLMWLRNPNFLNAMTWSNAVAYCDQLDGADGRGGYTDWRLPNIMELQSLVAWQYVAPALSNTAGTNHHAAGDPFANVGSPKLWSSTTIPILPGFAHYLYLFYGHTYYDIKEAYLHSVWPVRGGR